MRRITERLTQLYDEQPQWAAIATGIATLIGLTAIHAAISFTSAFRTLYVLPIWLATRMGGRVSGMVLVVLCTIANTTTEWQLGHGASESIISNFLLRFIALSAFMLLIAQVELGLQKHQRLALTDPLTGLMNRNALKEFAQHAFNRAMLREQPMTAVVIDCDGFKLINDTYGHKAGDHVLLMLAKALESQTRQTDLVARLGGDEFAVIFQNTDLEEARSIMFRVDESFVGNSRDAGYAAGLSIGFGTTSDGGNELDAVLEIADKAMYEHKQQKKVIAFLN